MVSGQFQLGLRQQHAARINAKLADFLDGCARWQLRPDQRHSNFLPLRYIRCAADNLQCVSSHVYFGQLEFIGFGNRLNGQNFTDDHVGETLGHVYDSFTGGPGHGQAPGHFFGRPVNIHQFTNPVIGNFHLLSCLYLPKTGAGSASHFHRTA